jgi:deoxycytidylate deaminase
LPEGSQVTCAKLFVYASLRVGKRIFPGWNGCRKPQKVCPRLPGEGYEKCHSICKQPWHAEECSIYYALKVGVDPTGGHMAINHEPCQQCQEIMEAWQISWEVV